MDLLSLSQGWAMCQYLPTGEFKFLPTWQLDEILQTAADADYGFFLEVELTCPEAVHDKLNDFPPAPSKTHPSQLSPFQREMIAWNIRASHPKWTNEKIEEEISKSKSNEKLGQLHYVWIKDMSRLLHGQSSSHHEKHFICDRCLHGCNSQRSLDKHTEKCQEYRAQRTIFPEPDTKLKFDKIGHQHPVEFFIIADLESSLEPFSTAHPDPSRSSSTSIARHVLNSTSYKSCFNRSMILRPSSRIQRRRLHWTVHR